MKKFNRKVVWNKTTESYDVVSDQWDIEEEISMYTALREKGFEDGPAASLVASLLQTRPVYRCFCFGDHETMGFVFNPCPCMDCEQLAKAEGFNISDPICHVSLSEAVIRLTAEELKHKLEALNQTLEESDVYISDNDFDMFKVLLSKYGTEEISWSEVVDDYEPKEDNHYLVVSVLEFFWLAYIVKNLSGL